MQNSDQSRTTERVAFAEEGSGSAVRVIVRGELDATLLAGLEGFIRRRRVRLAEDIVDAEWAE